MTDQESPASQWEQAPARPATQRSAPLLLRPIDVFRNHRRKENAAGLTFYQRYFCKAVVLPPPSRNTSNSIDVSGQGSSSSTSNASVSEQKQEATDSTSGEAADAVASSQAADWEPRRIFSPLSIGVVLSFLLLVVVILAILLPVLITQLAKRDNDHGRGADAHGASGQPFPDHPSSPSSLDDPLSFQFSKPPLRLALLSNFPDPSIHFDANTSTWYAFATNEAAGVLREGAFNPIEDVPRARANVQVATSTDFITWNVDESDPDALPNVGAWVRQAAAFLTGARSVSNSHSHSHSNRSDHNWLKRADVAPGLHIGDPSILLANVWAPDVIPHPTRDLYLLYYSAISESDAQHHHCIGAATATKLAGPYEPAATAVACHEAGAIDPVGVIDTDDNSTVYVAYKIDGNSMGHGGECNNMVQPQVSTPIMLQRMLSDGVSADPSFAPVQLLDRIEVDGPLIEAPSIVHVGRVWYLFYSSGCTRNPSYDVRYATAPNITGPYTRNPVPLLRTGDYELTAPGSVSVRWAGGASNATAAAAAADQNNNGGGTDSHSGGGASRESVATGWKIALHARVHARQGGVRAMFTAGLAFDLTTGNVTLINGTAH